MQTRAQCRVWRRAPQGALPRLDTNGAASDDARVRFKHLGMLLICVSTLLASAVVAFAKTYDVPGALGAALQRTDDRTPLAILLPSRLALDFDGRTYASGNGSSRSYGLSLTGAPNCGANACLLVTFKAERGGRPQFRRTVALRGGRTGYFKPLTCGGSCSPPIIQWVSRGNLYTIQAKVPDSTDAGQRRRLVTAANSALAAGPR